MFISFRRSQTSQEAFRIYGTLLNKAVSYWPIFLLGILGTVLLAITDATLVWLTQPMINKGLIAKEITFIRVLPLLILVGFALRGVASFISTYYIARVGRLLVMQLRREVFGHLLKLPAAFFDRSSSGNLVAKITYNADQISTAATEALLIVLREGALVLGAVVIMWLISWQLSLLFFIGLPIIILTIHYVSCRVRRVSHSLQQAMGEVTRMAGESIRLYKMIRLFNGQAHEQSRFERATQNICHLDLKVITTSALGSAVIQWLIALPIAAAIYLATRATTTITPGGFITFLVSMMRLIQPMRRLSNVNTQIQKGITAANSIFELLKIPLEKDMGPHKITSCRGAIRFEGVSFRYPNTQSLAVDQVSLSIQPHQNVALVGKSGSGKTTLMYLLLRLYSPRLGTIYLEDKSISSYTLETFRRQFAWVSQDVMLFNDTIFNNIAYTMGSVDRAAVLQAAEKAQVLTFAEHLPKGLDTLVGEGGERLSGGQKQRIAIARAFLKNAPILILDEATSALDTLTEHTLQMAMRELSQNRTTLTIAHRLSTIKAADCIFVMAQGKLVESGSHSDLLWQGGLYEQLFYATDSSDQNLESGDQLGAEEALARL